MRLRWTLRTNERNRAVGQIVRACRRRFPGMPQAIAERIGHDSLRVAGRNSVWFAGGGTDEDRAYALTISWVRHHETDYDKRAPATGWYVRTKRVRIARAAVDMHIRERLREWEGNTCGRQSDPVPGGPAASAC